ncbi:MAG: hypothetical protein QM775_14335 [Pirellulales bacterium]
MGWFDRLFRRPVQPAPAGPTLICSGCYTICRGSAAHVIPWWNESQNDFVTTYRCDGCLLQSLDETEAKVRAWDASTRDKFCEFLQRHRLPDLAGQIHEAPLPEATRPALAFLNRLRSGEHRLSP